MLPLRNTPLSTPTQIILLTPHPLDTLISHYTIVNFTMRVFVSSCVFKCNSGVCVRARSQGVCCVCSVHVVCHVFCMCVFVQIVLYFACVRDRYVSVYVVLQRVEWGDTLRCMTGYYLLYMYSHLSVFKHFFQREAYIFVLYWCDCACQFLVCGCLLYAP